MLNVLKIMILLGGIQAQWVEAACVLDIGQAVHIILRSQKLYPKPLFDLTKLGREQLLKARALLRDYGDNPDLLVALEKKGISKAELLELRPKIDESLKTLDAFLIVNLEARAKDPAALDAGTLDLMVMTREVLKDQIKPATHMPHVRSALRVIEGRLKKDHPEILLERFVDLEIPPHEPAPDLPPIEPEQPAQLIQSAQPEALPKPPVVVKPDLDLQLIDEIVALSQSTNETRDFQALVEKIKARADPTSKETLLALAEEAHSKLTRATLEVPVPEKITPRSDASLRQEAFREKLNRHAQWAEVKISAGKLLSPAELIQARQIAKQLRQASDRNLDAFEVRKPRKLLLEKLGNLISDTVWKNIEALLNKGYGPMDSEKEIWLQTAKNFEARLGRANDAVRIRRALSKNGFIRRKPLTEREKAVVESNFLIDKNWFEADLKRLPDNVQNHIRLTLLLQVAYDPSIGESRRSATTGELFRTIRFRIGETDYRFAYTQVGGKAVYIACGERGIVYKDLVIPRMEQMR